MTSQNCSKFERLRNGLGKHCTVSKFLESQPASYTAAIFDGDVVVAAPMRPLDRFWTFGEGCTKKLPGFRPKRHYINVPKTNQTTAKQLPKRCKQKLTNNCHKFEHVWTSLDCFFWFLSGQDKWIKHGADVQLYNRCLFHEIMAGGLALPFQTTSDWSTLAVLLLFLS